LPNVLPVVLYVSSSLRIGKGLLPLVVVFDTFLAVHPEALAVDALAVQLWICAFDGIGVPDWYSETYFYLYRCKTLVHLRHESSIVPNHALAEYDTFIIVGLNFIFDPVVLFLLGSVLLLTSVNEGLNGKLCYDLTVPQPHVRRVEYFHGLVVGDAEL
jgi:hypothetical protein